MKTGEFRRGNWRHMLKVLKTHPLTRITSGDSEFSVINAVVVFKCRECGQKTSYGVFKKYHSKSFLGLIKSDVWAFS